MSTLGSKKLKAASSQIQHAVQLVRLWLHFSPDYAVREQKPGTGIVRAYRVSDCGHCPVSVLRPSQGREGYVEAESCYEVVPTEAI